MTALAHDRGITRDAPVSLAFTGKPCLLGKPQFFISVQGIAQLIQEKAAFECPRNPDLERRFE